MTDEIETLTGEYIYIETDNQINIESLVLDGRSIQDITETSPSPNYPSEIESIEGINLLSNKFDEYYKGSYNTYKFGDLGEEYTVQILDNDTSVDISGLYILVFKTQNYSGDHNGLVRNGVIEKRNLTFNDYNYIGVYPNTEEAFNKVFQRFKIQVNKGAIPKPYVPYQHIAVDVIRKNLFNINDNHIQVAGGSYKYEFILKPNTNYTLSSNVPSSSPASLYFNGGSSETNGVSLNNSKTVTTDSSGYLFVYVRYDNSGGGYNLYDEVLNGTYWIQLEEGDVSTSQEDYKNNQYLVNLKGNKLRSLSNGVKDELIIENGRAKIIKKIRTLELNISDMNYTDSYPGWTNQSQIKQDYPDANVALNTLCTYITNMSENNSGVGINTIGNGIIVLYENYFQLTQTEWKELYPNAIFVLQYELATPEEIDLGEVFLQPYVYQSDTISNSEDTEMILFYTESLLPITKIKNNDKELLESGDCTISTKIITEDNIVLTETDSVENWKHSEERYVPDYGFIGQFTARTLSGQLQNITEDFNIENKKLELQMSINTLDGMSASWYTFGRFIVSKPESDEVVDNTKFDAFDSTILFNIPFDPDYTNDTFPHSFNATVETDSVLPKFTAKKLAHYVCAQAGVPFGTVSFNNDDFEIPTNQFTEDNTCRDVMKAISQLAYGWVEVAMDNACYIVTPEIDNEYETELNPDNYYGLEIQKTPYGPVNSVHIGMSAVTGDDEVVKDNNAIEQNDGIEVAINVYDNPITNTPELRELAKSGAENLWGLSYTPIVNTETIGHPWLRPNKKISVINLNGDEYSTYPFTIITDYTGHIKTQIASEGETKVETEYDSGKTIAKELRKVSFVLDQQEGTITQTATDLDAANKLITTVEQKITSTEANLNVISKNIDPVTGDVTEVTTTNGLTFNKDGLNLHTSDNSFNAQHTPEGTYYREGDEVISSTTKDGFLSTNLKNKGQHSYCYDAYNDRYDFVEERIEENGEVCYATFWNGDDY